MKQEPSPASGRPAPCRPLRHALAFAALTLILLNGKCYLYIGCTEHLRDASWDMRSNTLSGNCPSSSHGLALLLSTPFRRRRRQVLAP